MTKTIKLIFCFLFLLLGKQSVGIELEVPKIVAGTSKITGRIIGPGLENGIFVNIGVPHPISGELVQYKVAVDSSGSFSIDVEIETAFTLIGLSTSLNLEKPLLVKLTNGVVTNMDIAYNSDGDIEYVHVTPAAMTQNNMTQSMALMYKMMGYISEKAPEPMYDKSIDDFLNYAKTVISERLEILNNDRLVSNELKGLLSKDFRLSMYRTHVLDYEQEMRTNYRNTNRNKTITPDIQKIDRTYFRFLKDFKLDNPEYLNCVTFPEFQKDILQNETLGLPEIGEMDIPSWIANVKAILANLVGFNNSPYYDILAANAYGRQLNEELRPLTEKQRKNIANYWKNGEITKILFRKNQQVVELDKFKSPAVVNEIASVPDDKVMEAILAKYLNKVVFIDLWATWCAPCLSAMQQFRSTKGNFHDKDVVFVYLTNGSSPRKLWEEKIKGIGSEQYYLSDSQWYYMMDHFDFEGIPSYLLYDKKGELINKFTAFPGNGEVKEMIDGLL